MSTSAFLNNAEAAYVAGLTAPAISRAIEQRIVAAPFLRMHASHCISRLAAAFISYYSANEKQLPLKQIRATLTANMERITSSGEISSALALRILRKHEVDSVLTAYINAARLRARKLDAMRHAITISDDVMWGMPVFRGTRVLAETVAGSVQEGEPLARLKDSYAFLTEDMLEAAKTYFEIYPFQGHVTHISDSHPDWKIRSVKKIYLEKNDLAPLYRRMLVTEPGQDG